MNVWATKKIRSQEATIGGVIEQSETLRMACHDMGCMPSCVDWSDRFSETVSEDSWDRRRGIGGGHVI